MVALEGAVWGSPLAPSGPISTQEISGLASGFDEVLHEENVAAVSLEEEWVGEPTARRGFEQPVRRGAMAMAANPLVAGTQRTTRLDANASRGTEPDRSEQWATTIRTSVAQPYRPSA